jgi:hypothetical protein
VTSPSMLDCPDPENYAAVALQMQETALQVEQRLYAVERTLRAAANRQTFVQTTTAVRTGLTTGGFQPIAPQSVTNVVTFNNWPGTGGAFFFFDIPTDTGAGAYEIGFYGNLIASGAVTDNSFRAVRIRQERLSSSGTPFNVDIAQATIFEANVGGGMDLTVTGTFVAQLGDEFDIELDHGNAGSTLNVSSGAVYWVTYLGSPETVEVF